MRNFFCITITFLIAFMLTLLPMPEWTIWLRPAWIPMVLFYWITLWPHRVNVGVAWFMGILWDVSSGTLLGEHALSLTVMAYLASKMHRRFRLFSVVQQGFIILLFILLYQFILFCIQGVVGNLPKTGLYWLCSVTSMVLWPWIFIILQDYRRRYLL